MSRVDSTQETVATGSSFGLWWADRNLTAKHSATAGGEFIKETRKMTSRRRQVEQKLTYKHFRKKSPCLRVFVVDSRPLCLMK
jgi:hypothetical protein